MSETENRIHRVTWRSIPDATIAGGGYGEFLDTIDVTAAYYVRDDGMVVFKKADGEITFTVSEPLVETIRPVEGSISKAAGGVIPAGQAAVVFDDTPPLEVPPRQQVAEAGRDVTINVTGSAVAEEQLMAAIRQGVRRRNPGTAVA